MERIDQINNIELLKNKYASQADEDGYIFTATFATQELRRQNKSIASFLDNDEGTGDYDLGKDIRFKGSSGNYSEMKIHIDDLDEFVKRVKEHYGEN
jgi:archaellum component FlaC